MVERLKDRSKIRFDDHQSQIFIRTGRPQDYIEVGDE